MIKPRSATNLLFLFIFFLFTFDLAFSLPSATYVSPTAYDNITATLNWTYINVTSSETLNRSMVEWGNASGLTNITMINSSLTNWFFNISNLTDRTYNYTVWMQNTTGNWSQSSRKWITIDTISPYNISVCQNLSVGGGNYTIVQNVASAGTCFSVNADNITLDGSGYIINYSKLIAGYAINVSGAIAANLKNLRLVQGNASVSDAHAILFKNVFSGVISNNTITAAGNTSHGIYLLFSDTNTLSNNTVIVSGINSSAIVLNSSASNAVVGGSLISGAYYDYYLQSAGALNNFTNTNFTGKRRIYFADIASSFNYNNQTAGGIWLRTNVSAAGYLNRTLINWNVTLLKWNDTNGTGSTSAEYVISGLLPNVSYALYNTSAGLQSNPYNLTTDAAGQLSGISIIFGGNTEIRLSKGAPIITLLNPLNETSFSSGTVAVLVNITTNENATCRYNLTNSSFSYLDGTLMDITGNKSHSFTYNGLVDGKTYSIYYKCNDTYGNTNPASVTHVFRIANPVISQSPIISSSFGSNMGVTAIKSITTSPNDIVIKLVVDFSSTKNRPSISVVKLSHVPVSKPEYAVYHYFNFTKRYFNDSDIANATIEFKVNRSWILSNNITVIRLERYVGDWEALPTELIESSAGYNRYKTVTPGFSYFAIVGEKQILQNDSASVQIKQTKPAVNRTDADKKSSPDLVDSTTVQNEWPAAFTTKNWSLYDWILFAIAAFLVLKLMRGIKSIYNFLK